MTAFNFQTILVVGATSGIGWALAERLLNKGRKMIIVGRRQAKLDEFISQHSGGAVAGTKISSYVFDVTKLSEIADWAKKWVPCSL
jgi:NADP-dependent 3-hydroxy acid dehydrogenase YdfG